MILVAPELKKLCIPGYVKIDYFFISSLEPSSKSISE